MDESTESLLCTSYINTLDDWGQVLDRDFKVRDRDSAIPYLSLMKQDSIDEILGLAIEIPSSESV